MVTLPASRHLLLQYLTSNRQLWSSQLSNHLLFTVPVTLNHIYRCVPEFVLENIVVLITMARRTVGASSEEADVAGLLHPALTLVLTFMGDSTRTYNPHLRWVCLCMYVTLSTALNIVTQNQYLHHLFAVMWWQGRRRENQKLLLYVY